MYLSETFDHHKSYHVLTRAWSEIERQDLAFIIKILDAALENYARTSKTLPDVQVARDYLLNQALRPRPRR